MCRLLDPFNFDQIPIGERIEISQKLDERGARAAKVVLARDTVCENIKQERVEGAMRVFRLAGELLLDELRPLNAYDNLQQSSNVACSLAYNRDKKGTSVTSGATPIDVDSASALSIEAICIKVGQNRAHRRPMHLFS